MLSRCRTSNPHPLHRRHDRADLVQFTVGEHEAVDERPAGEVRARRAPALARRLRGPCDRVVHHPPARAQERVATGEVRLELRQPDVLEHADRADRVERPVVDVAVVLQPHFDAVGDTRFRDALLREFGLALRHRDAHGVHAVFAGRVQQHATPTATDVEEPHAGLRARACGTRVRVWWPARPRARSPASRTPRTSRSSTARARPGRNRSRRRSGARSRPRRAPGVWRRPERRASSGGSGSGRNPDAPTSESASRHCAGDSLSVGDRWRSSSAANTSPSRSRSPATYARPEPELTGRGDEPADRVGGPDHDRGGGVGRSEGAAVVGTERNRQVAPEQGLDE